TVVKTEPSYDSAEDLFRSALSSAYQESGEGPTGDANTAFMVAGILWNEASLEDSPDYETKQAVLATYNSGASSIDGGYVYDSIAEIISDPSVPGEQERIKKLL
ncbi:MAG TPA: hypothetical protein DCM40_30215, partial [Maribacter sp.]|nr:hypothetical protein [Maribacter sp.]